MNHRIRAREVRVIDDNNEFASIALNSNGYSVTILSTENSAATASVSSPNPEVISKYGNSIFSIPVSKSNVTKVFTSFAKV